MSRKILTLVLTSIFVLSFGLSAFAQNADQKIEITGGTAPTFADTINNLNAMVGNAATYNYLVSINTNGLHMNAASLGLVMYSPDGSLNPSGATISNATLVPSWNTAAIWGLEGQFNTMLTGDLPELLLYGGVGNAKAPNTNGGGLQNNVFAAAMTWDVTFSGDGVFCVDSSFFPPAADYLAIDENGDGIGPSLVGGSGDGAVGGNSPSAFCVTSFEIPDLPPECAQSNETEATLSHCDVYNTTITATDPDDENDPISYSATTSGAGTVTVGSSNGNVMYTPSASDVNGDITITINASEPDGPNTDCIITLTITNVDPTLTCANALAVAKGNSVTTPAPNGVSGDCDALSYSLVGGVSPEPDGAYSIDAGTGAITFDAAESDAPGVDKVYTFTIEVTDGIATAQCTIDINVLNTAPFCVVIDKVDDVFQGGSQSVDIIFEGGSNEVGGFNFLIQYDASALSLAGVSRGSIYDGTDGWEFFDFRFGPNGNCNGGCPSGKARVIGLADQNDGSPGGNTVLDVGDTFASLNFLVTNDRTLECQFVPIRFCWVACGDNSLSSPGGDTLYISRNVFDYVGTDPDNQDPASAGRANITGADQSFPTLTGAPDFCLEGDGQKLPPLTFVDFKNGGIKIVCAHDIDDRGDLNLNGISNEIADAVIYTSYFVSGLSAFDGLIATAGPNAAQAAIAASDVNADGLALSVADLVYLIRIIVGDAMPINKLTHGVNSVEISTKGDVISTDTELGAALFVFAGTADVKLLANNMNLEVGVVDGNTHALVFDIGSESIAIGEILTANSALISVEAVDYNGNVLNSSTTMVPTSFAVHQNYPNPFNPSTKISFDVPSASEYTVTIYNVAGQKVHEITGVAGSAGTVLVEWNASNQASGIYFYNVKTANASATKKMVLLK